MRLGRQVQGGVEVGAGAVQLAQVHAGAAAVEQGHGQVGGEPRRLGEEGPGQAAVALLVQHGAQRVPQPRVVGMGLDGGADDRDGLGVAVLVAQRPGQAVHRLQPVGLAQQQLGPEGFGQGVLAHAPGEAAEIGQQLGVVGRSRQGTLIGGQGGGNVAGLLQGLGFCAEGAHRIGHVQGRFTASVERMGLQSATQGERRRRSARRLAPL